MPRSGSELLQVILHQNPRIYASATSPLLEFQFAARSQLNLSEVKAQPKSLMDAAFTSVCCGIAKGYYSAITDRPIVIDKSRGWLHYWEWVNRWNANPKIICMVRDLRDIVCSMERIFRANKHMPDSIDIPAEMKNITVDQRINYWLNTQPIGLALQRLYDANARGVSEKVLFVKYENLCSQPKQEMQRIYEYIEEEYFEHDFNNLAKEVIEDDSYFGIYGSHAVQTSLKPSSKTWKDILDSQSSNGIRNFASWYFEQFCY